MSNEPIVGFSWSNRRRAVFASLAFCALTISSSVALVAVGLIPPSFAQEVIQYAFTAGSACLFAYAFGASAENIWGVRR